MLGWLLLGAVIGIAIIVTVEDVREEMQKRHVKAAVVEMIDGCNNKVKFRDLIDSWYTFTIEGEASDELYEGKVIHA